MIQTSPSSRVLRHTRGRCNHCLEDVPARVEVREDAVFLVKSCSADGESEQLLSRAPEYWEELDNFYFKVNAEDYAQRDYIVRMTETCNLDCPICLAKANTEDTPDLDLAGLEGLLSERRGIKVDLMAAEPTLRKDLVDWIRRVKATGNLAALHTNGLKLASKRYLQTLKDAGLDEVFLQFDGMDEEANIALRGRPLLQARLQALKNLRELDIGTSLIVVVARDLNEAQVQETFQFALRPENQHIKEVFFLGLRLLGSARDAMTQGTLGENSALMPDEIIDLLTAQEPRITRQDIRRFNKLYFAMLSAMKLKKCLYVQHYLVARDGEGGFQPASELLDLERLDRAAERYGERFEKHPVRARARLIAELGLAAAKPATVPMLLDFLRLQTLMKTGMNLAEVPQRFLLIGFITACDPHNFDADVAINCGKGELSTDGGYVESGAVANVDREARFAESDRRPGAKGKP